RDLLVQAAQVSARAEAAVVGRVEQQGVDIRVAGEVGKRLCDGLDHGCVEGADRAGTVDRDPPERRVLLDEDPLVGESLGHFLHATRLRIRNDPGFSAKMGGRSGYKEGSVSEGKVIEFVGVSMTFGDTPAVEELTARVEPGRVTAFLGPNGAGKTTTLRMLLGDLRATSGTATIGGTEYTRITKPATSIGAVMSIAPLERSRRKTATKYLPRAARRIGVGSSRVREVLQIVGLAEMGDMRIGSLSLGMKHRLTVAEALLGDPGVLVFDEPANGLDPEGIRWIRLLMRGFADEGRTVLMSSHLLSEVEQVADSLMILNEGRLLFEGPIELLAEAEGGMVTVDADDRAELAKALTGAGFSYRVLRSGLAIDETTTTEIGTLATTAGIALTTLTHRGPTLEDVYLQIIEGSWVAPARSAALAPAPLSFDEVLAGSSEEAVADPAA